MNKIGDAIISIGDQITVLSYAIKYWLRGEDWSVAIIIATYIVKGWR